MRHILAIFIYTMMLSTSLLHWQRGYVAVQALRTPELFGDADAIVLVTDHEIRGLIFNEYFGGILTGSIEKNEVACRITQVSGEQIHGIDRFVPCYAIIKGEKWTGWIDFRGHHRKLCGAKSIEILPMNCSLEK